MSKFFVGKENIRDGKIYISNEDVLHITKVLRLSKNDVIIVSDTKGTDYSATIESITKNEVVALITNQHICENEPKVNVSIFQGLPKSTKMEYIIQKAVELGVHSIIPVITKYTVVKVEDGKSLKNKLERWNKISEEAAKQCGRGIIPEILTPVTFKEAIRMMGEYEFPLMAYEKENTKGISSVLHEHDNVDSIAVLIGPEGGFCEEEAKLALDSGITMVGLGKRILRTETAPVTILSIIMYQYNEM